MSEKTMGAEGLPKRWSARRKSEVVLRLPRGEDIGEVSREIRVPPPELQRCRRTFLAGACEGQKGRSAPDGELMRTHAKLGEMTSCGARTRRRSRRGRRAGAGSSSRWTTAYPTWWAGSWRAGGDRWAALDPVRQGVRTHMGGFEKAIAAGLGLGHDRGPQYRPRAFQAEIAWLGIRFAPAYVGEPECNGVAERFFRTLTEECVDLHDFETLEEAGEVIGAFIERYNSGWLLQRTGIARNRRSTYRNQGSASSNPQASRSTSPRWPLTSFDVSGRSSHLSRILP